MAFGVTLSAISKCIRTSQIDIDDLLNPLLLDSSVTTTRFITSNTQLYFLQYSSRESNTTHIAHTARAIEPFDTHSMLKQSEKTEERK